MFFENIRKSILDGNVKGAVEFVEAAVQKGVSAKEIIELGVVPGIGAVGELFEKGEYYLPELIVCGKTANAVLNVVEPLLEKEEGKFKTGKFLIGTIKGDVHDIGKNIVVMMLKSNGWEVMDLGVDVSPSQFCDAVKDGDYDILGISALLSMTMVNIPDVIETLRKAGLRDRIKIMIGGAPVTQQYTDQIGADAYGRDAWVSVKIAQALVSGR